MDRRNQLEHALRASAFARDDLAVYADALLAEGDPRGELIALDLDPHRTPAWHERRRALQLLWTGLPTALRHLNLGFFDEVGDDPEGLALLASPGGAYVRGFRTSGVVRTARLALAKLAARERPWLAKLAITATTDEGVGDALVEELIAHAPALRELDVSGIRVLRGFPHPGITHLTVSGATAIHWSRPPPAVTSLDVAFLPRDADGELGEGQRIDFLAGAQLHGLRRLDLSRNESGARGPHHLAGLLDATEVLLESPLRAQLTHLVLPSLEGEALVNVRRAAKDMPGLQELRVARLYASVGDALKGTAPSVILPERWPWPRGDQLDGRDALSVAMPYAGEGEAHDVDLAGVIGYLEQVYAALKPAAKDAWHQLFAFVDELEWDQSQGFPFAVLELALAACPDGIEDVARWAALRHTMFVARGAGRVARGDQVRIRRYWGW